MTAVEALASAKQQAEPQESRRGDEAMHIDDSEERKLMGEVVAGRGEMRRVEEDE